MQPWRWRRRSHTRATVREKRSKLDLLALSPVDAIGDSEEYEESGWKKKQCVVIAIGDTSLSLLHAAQRDQKSVPRCSLCSRGVQAPNSS